METFGSVAIAWEQKEKKTIFNWMQSIFHDDDDDDGWHIFLNLKAIWNYTVSGFQLAGYVTICFNIIDRNTTAY